MWEVQQLRGRVVETRHPVSVAVVQGKEGRVAGLGGPVRTTWRSACKPFQLHVSLEALGDPDLPDCLLAIGAASHAGEPPHVEHVEEVLRRFGVGEPDLRCAPHPPIHRPSADSILLEGGWFTDLHNNCSGKHAFMVAACRARGWEGDYREPGHPLQERVAERVAELAGERPELAVDGCGVPTFVTSLEGLARAFHVLACCMAGDASLPRADVLARIGRAMAAHPLLVSGTGLVDEELARGAREPLVSKVGAAGVHGIALPARRMGIAVKVHSGDAAARAVATAWALETFAPGAFHPPTTWDRDVVRNVAGRPVGTLRVRPQTRTAP